MPKLSVWMVRASLIYMGIGFVFGGLILYQKGALDAPWAWLYFNAHADVMVYGWTVQFVMGMAIWILPRFPIVNRYGKIYLGWWSFGLLNGGLLLSTMDVWLRYAPLLSIGRLCNLAAVVTFVVMMWPRVKPISDYLSAQKDTDV
jgi:hypothetical protein